MAEILKSKSIYYNDVNLVAQPCKVKSRKDIPIELNRIIVSPMEAIVGKTFALKANELGLTLCLHRFCSIENQVDLFINGDLARSMNLKDNLPKKDESDKIIIGADKPKNVPGAICNIRYFRTPLTSAQIARTYNMLFMSNPPVNNLR
jgi:hypothetical protein